MYISFSYSSFIFISLYIYNSFVFHVIVSHCNNIFLPCIHTLQYNILSLKLLVTYTIPWNALVFYRPLNTLVTLYNFNALVMYTTLNALVISMTFEYTGNLHHFNVLPNINLVHFQLMP